jgi:hypothetical protein
MKKLSKIIAGIFFFTVIFVFVYSVYPTHSYGFPNSPSGYPSCSPNGTNGQYWSVSNPSNNCGCDTCPVGTPGGSDLFLGYYDPGDGVCYESVDCQCGATCLINYNGQECIADYVQPEQFNLPIGPSPCPGSGSGPIMQCRHTFFCLRLRSVDMVMHRF